MPSTKKNLLYVYEAFVSYLAFICVVHRDLTL